MSNMAPIILSIGNFDGLHLGHQHLLSLAQNFARERQAQTLVVSFFPHPTEVLFPEKASVRLFDLQEQSEQLKNLGIDRFERLEFTREFSNLTAQDFFKFYILKKWMPKAIFVGHDFRFGSGRAGDRALLEDLCKQNNIWFQAVQPYKINNEIVSSTLIRSKLQAADLVSAELLLGKQFYLTGKVVHGKKQGRQIEFPTANLKISEELQQRIPLKMGVYGVKVLHADKELFGVMNVGINPTLESTKEIKIEIHIFDFNQDIYDHFLKVTPLFYLREEKKFSSLAQLKSQISEDIILAKERLK